MADVKQITVNGKGHAVEATPDRPLLDVLREDLHLAGTHYGCGTGDCGACGVLIDGRRAFACQVQLSDLPDKPITTVEGLAKGDTLHPVQQAFVDAGGFQCGYCTPGMMMAVIGALNEEPNLGDEQLLARMDKNLCRCCGYINIAAAVKKAAAAVRAEGTR